MLKEKSSLKGSFTDLMIGHILSGELCPGDKLPPERELALQFNISRGSVNQGILDMERMGFIRVVPRHGNYVADYLRNTTPEISSAIMNYDSARIYPALFRDLMSLRILVECECAALVAEHISKASIDTLAHCTNRLFDATDDSAADALFEYHICIVKLSDNSAYLLLFQSYEKMIRKLIDAHYASSSNELERVLPLYNRLTSEISLGNSVAARHIMGDILGYAASYLNKLLS